MSNVTTLLKYSLKTNTIKALYQDVVSRLSYYYYTFGKSTPWPTVTQIQEDSNVVEVVSDEDNPPAVSDTYTYELDTRKNIQYAKLINPNDVAVVIPRYDWSVGTIYDQYDEYTADRPSRTGLTQLSQTKFYVLTDEFNVYKCLYNNKNKPSSVKPSGTSTQAFTTSDGYIWKFMYSIPLSLKNKFLQSKYMPVVTSLSDQFYGRGGIKNYRINKKGRNYVSSTWRVKSVRVISGGSGYTVGGTTLQFDVAPGTGTRAQAAVTQVDSNGAIVAVSVTVQGSGYRVQPQIKVLTAPAGAQGAQFLVEYERTNTNGYTEIIVDGDGFNELNPYSIKTAELSKKVMSVTLTDAGLLYADTDTVTVTFSAPQIVGGVNATGTVTSTVSGTTRTITGVTITNPGSGYTSAPTVTFSAPANTNGTRATGTAVVDFNRGVFTEIPGGELFAFPAVGEAFGQIPDIDVTFREISGVPGSYEVDTVTLNSGGFGYKIPLIYGQNVLSPVLQAAGILLDLNTATQKNHAKLVPIINSRGEITALQVTEQGVGYSFVTIKVIGYRRTTIGGVNALYEMVAENPPPVGKYYFPGFQKADITVDFSVGDADTKQSDVELLAVDGSIEVINVDEGGGGFGPTSVLTVIGDGTGCTCVPVIGTNGELTKVVVTNPGRGYTFASVQVTGGGVNAVIRPIISPKGGHGKDAIEELYANSIVFTTRLVDEKNQGTLIVNDFRQVTIIKDLAGYNDETYYSSPNGSACALLRLSKDNVTAETFAAIQNDDILYKSNDTNKYVTVVEKQNTDDFYELVVSLDTNYLPTFSDSLVKLLGTAPVAIIALNSVVSPTIDKYSGQMLYVDNRVKFLSNEEQTVVVNTLITL